MDARCGPSDGGLSPEVTREVDAGGMRIPRCMTAGYQHGTDTWAEGRFIRWTVDEAPFV